MKANSKCLLELKDDFKLRPFESSRSGYILDNKLSLDVVLIQCLKTGSRKSRQKIDKQIGFKLSYNIVDQKIEKITDTKDLRAQISNIARGGSQGATVPPFKG